MLSCFEDVVLRQNEFLEDCLIAVSIAAKDAIAINFELIDGAL